MLKKILLLLLLFGGGLGLLLLTSGDSRFDLHQSLRLPQPAEKVWQVLADVDAWQDWWPGMEMSRLHGPLETGSKILLRLDGVPEDDPAVLVALEPGRRLAWQRSGFLGSLAATAVLLNPQSTGTEVTITHSISGPQAKLADFSNRESFAQYQHLFLKALEQHLQKQGGEND